MAPCFYCRCHPPVPSLSVKSPILPHRGNATFTSNQIPFCTRVYFCALYSFLPMGSLNFICNRQACLQTAPHPTRGPSLSVLVPAPPLFQMLPTCPQFPPLPASPPAKCQPFWSCSPKGTCPLRPPGSLEAQGPQPS